MSFRDDLTDWCDWDDAAYALGVALHVFDGVDKRRANAAIMTANDFGTGLHEALMALVRSEVLEHRVEPDEQFRWVYAGPDGLVGSRAQDSILDDTSTGEDAAAVEGPDGETPPRIVPWTGPPVTFASEPPPPPKWWQRGPLSPS